MPPDFSSRCWAALCAKYPEFAQHGNLEPELIIAGALQAFQAVKPDSVNGIPPTREQLTAYFHELNSAVNPDDFLDHYSMVGWVVGTSGKRMKDWRAACRLWARRQAAGTAPSFASRGQNIGSASLFALQAQLKTLETEMEGILYPGGCTFKQVPQGPGRLRFDKLAEQRHAIKSKIDAFAS